MITAEAWRQRGSMVETAAGRVFAVDAEFGAGGDPRGLPLIVLHGFPTSSWDFAESLSVWPSARRVILLDFLGFGFSEKPDWFSYSLFEQADVFSELARHLGLSRVHIWAHDMGTSVLTELLARQERGLLPMTIESIVLMNGSVHIDMASLTVAQRVLASPLGSAFVRLNSRTVFAKQLARIVRRPLEKRAIDTMWALMTREEGLDRLPAIIGYLGERKRFVGRWVGALKRFERPALVAWGKHDPVAVSAIAQRLSEEIPTSRLHYFAELGHYPQVEGPREVAEVVDEHLGRVDAGEIKTSLHPGPVPAEGID